MKSYLAIAFVVAAFCGCYTMPTCDDYSVIPNTNNPDVTREVPSQGLMPGAPM